MPEPSHPRLVVCVSADALELAQLELWELGATGIEQLDESTFDKPSQGSLIELLASFADERDAALALEALRSRYDVELTDVPHENWAIEWRRGFEPQRIGKRLLLQPSWKPGERLPGDVVLTIDPENAFGSGDHETTRLVLGVLERSIRGGESVLDVGCGTGVLSIAALCLGASSAVAVDIEEDAVTVAHRNASVNGVADRLHASSQSLSELEQTFDVVLANIQTCVLVPMEQELRRHVAPGGYAVLSGILRQEEDELLAAFDTWKRLESLYENDWVAYVLEPEEP
jgi:ribosomal protein L11 methyltransferase